MRLLVIADRPPSKSIKKTLEENSVDVICTLGDLDLFQIRELEDITHIPKIGVYGNHCSGKYFEALGIMNMHMATWEYEGKVFGGFEGCVRYKDSPSAKMYTQEEASRMLAQFPRVDVMLVHCPPYGINDDRSEISHTGYKGLRDYLDRAHPGYLLHGHTYPKSSELITEYGGTQIRYVSGDAIITIA